MPESDSGPANRLLIKLHPSSALRATASRVRIEPLYEVPFSEDAFGFDAAPRWFVAELPDGAASPWDLAHARVGDQLGIAESDIVFVEPDIIHDVFHDTNGVAPGTGRRTALERRGEL